MTNLIECLKILPTDYSEYGGDIKRWERKEINYPDCSMGCKFFVQLEEQVNFGVLGICAKKGAPRAGMLTWEHQAGLDCFERK
jgi:hypothetical protein